MSEPDPSKLQLLTPRRFGSDGYPHEDWTWLRRHHPICRMDDGVMEPYWAITRHADVMDISKRPEDFTNAPTINVVAADATARTSQARTIVHMDPPDHRVYRAVTSRSFTPRAISTMTDRVREIAATIIGRELDRAEAGETIDFVETIAAWHPLAVISELLGIPEQDQAHILGLTNQILSGTDPEYMEGENPVASASAGTAGFLEYMANLAADRRACPADDLATVLAQATIDDRPMPDFELISYYMAIATAGHDTTRNALTGGLAALLEHPEQLAALRADRTLTETAADEILRWSTPVIHFARTAAHDTEVAGHRVVAGERVALFYPSANRDEDVFTHPFTFDIERSPNPHLTFGFGEHYCIGQALARLEVRALFDVLLDMVSDIEIAGPVEHLAANFVGGIKHLPLKLQRA